MSKLTGNRKSDRPKPVPKAASSSFSFGARRYISKGPRRLFQPQEGLASPVFEPHVERPNTILATRVPHRPL